MNLASPPKATRREWIGLAVLALPCMLATMDLTVLNLAVPHIVKDLNPSASQLLWIVDIYGFLIAASLITMGTLGDHIGRRKLLLIGAAAFGVTSVLAAFSTSAPMLIATRALLGIAGATLAPSTLSLLRNMFLDSRERTMAIGVWLTSFSVGGAIGPLVGGALLEHFWWGSAFLIGVPVMILLLIIGPRLLPEFRDPTAGRLDVVSTLMSLVAVLGIIYSLKRTAEDGVEALSSWCGIFGVLILILFIRRQKRMTDPLIDPNLFRNPAFGASLIMNSISFFACFGFFLFVSQYLQLVLAQSPLQAGLWTMPGALGFVVGAVAVPPLVSRLRPAYLMSGGLTLAAIGFVIVAQVNGSNSLDVVVIGSIVYAIGLTPMTTLATDIIIGSAPPERAGVAAALSETTVELGGALGIAVLGSMGAFLYRSKVAGILPVDLSTEASDIARRTLGGAVAVAGQISDPTSTLLLEIARKAFAETMQVTAFVCAGLCFALAVSALVFLRQVPRGKHG